ncbi:hypothetical protein PseudUWO311_05975 [Pseudanabaena sp. UWO311]|uniref:hypothetical protein n=1 Tax=Pseudanabaena sp. UWO311 TaxID=2487337 RepID=UPI00115BB756|nr:hypothetical protein [Pseudanabaena sp. UWO311]TYQ27981.1 hypothetical protein PseudUWO311_05975 [Pseudanabaena sp. UWO311]
MKISSVFCISAISASTLITFSTAAFAISQPQNSSANSLLQPLQISNLSTQKLAGEIEVGQGEEEDEESDETSGRRCPPRDPICGWW